MLKPHYFLLGLSLFFSAGNLQAQDLTGLWKGWLYNDSTGLTQKYEIAISEEKGKLFGYSHTWFILEDKQYYGVKKVSIKKSDGKILIVDDGLIANNYPVKPAKNVRQLNVLELDATGRVMVLEGPFSTNRTKQYAPLTGFIHVERINEYWQTSLVPHLQELHRLEDLSFLSPEDISRNTVVQNSVKENPEKIQKETKKTDAISQPDKKEMVKTESKTTQKEMAKTEVVSNPKKKTIVEKETKTATNKAEARKQASTAKPKKKDLAATEIKKETETSIAVPKILPEDTMAAAKINERTTEIQQTVFFSSDSLELSLYDNGEVDGDTVSVLLNGEVILAKQRLSTRAVKKMIYIPSGTHEIHLVMYAESLGSIPPNTGLLVIRDGKKMYEVRFSGDLKRNAGIVFTRKEP